MIRLSKAIAARMRRSVRVLTRAEEGTATIEFVLFFPVIMTIFMSAFESGMFMVRQVMLERAMDVSIRDLRTGSWETPTADDLKQRICDIATIIPDCMDVVLLELRPVSTVTWEPLTAEVTCVERDEPLAPVTQWTNGAENEMMLVRACAVFDPVFPLSGMGLHLPVVDGGYAMSATTAFVNEPD